MSKKLVLAVLGICLLMVLAACGGGGDNHNNNGSNVAPVANAGPDQTVTTGAEVKLDGSGCSDVDGNTLTYSWSFTSVPDGSGITDADLSDATAVNPTFTTDLSGPYVVQLIVNDGMVDSAADTVKIRGLALPDTGQTTCYDGSSAQDCNNTGQDGEYSINPMSFADNGDGTVTDNVTGLMWQKDDDGIGYNWYEASGTYDAAYNPSSADVCASLALADYNDWRLPTKKELMGIVDYGTYNPAIDTTAFSSSNWSIRYWSSTNAVIFSNYAWYSDFSDGDLDYGNKILNYYVRCVRGSSPAQSFSDNGDGTVTDNGTGLMWQKCSAGLNNDATCSGTASAMLWQDALDYCNVLSLAGFDDWRLPNVKELESITDDSKYFPAIDVTVFPSTDLNVYWSSTTDESPTFYTWTVSFGYGTTFFGSKSVTNDYVRCVR